MTEVAPLLLDMESEGLGPFVSPQLCPTPGGCLGPSLLCLAGGACRSQPEDTVASGFILLPREGSGSMD